MSEQDDILAVLKRLDLLLTSLVKWHIAHRIDEVKADKTNRTLYENVGVLKQTELAKKAGIAQSGVSETLQKWEAEGLLVKEGTQYRRLF